MERDHLEPNAGASFRDPSRERLLQHATQEQEQSINEQPSRFKSLHRPRAYSASSYTSQPEEDYAPPANFFPDERSRKTLQPNDETPFGGRAGYVAVQGASQLWLPFWLSKIVLICFLLLFASLLTALLLVWYANDQRDGFYVADSTSPFTWTYGPTAVLVISISLWRMVDYHCKTLTPWEELRRGPVVASRSLRLDYLSPLQLASLWKALGNGHIAVVATIVGFILLKLTTIFSTGLFVLDTVAAVDTNFRLKTTTKFDPALASAFNGTSVLNPSTISNSAVYSWYAHLAHGLPYSPGVSDSYVYQTVEGAGVAPTNATITAEVDAFVVTPRCHSIDVKIDGPTSIAGLNKTNAFSTSLSLILPDGDICKHWSYVSVPLQDPQHFITPTKQITGTYQGVYCSTSNASQVDLARGFDAYLYTVTDVRYTQKIFPNATTVDNGTNLISFVNSTSRTVKQITNVLCQPTYTVTQINVTNSTVASLNGFSGQTRLANVAQASNRTIPGFSDRNLSSVFTAMLEASGNLFGVALENTFSVHSAPQVPSTVFSLMAVTQNSKDFSIFLDGELLTSTAEQVFKGISLEFASQNLMSPDRANVTGQATYPQQRLYIRPVSLWVMVAGFGILMLLTILLLFFAPSAVVSRDPSSVAAHAAILARSTDLNRELRREGATQDQSQRSILSPHFYRASVIASDTIGTPVFKIQVQLGGRSESIPGRNLPIVSWWNPLTLSSPVLLAMIILPVGAIVGLEFLQRASDRDSGLLTLRDSYFNGVYIHYIPALLMLLVATLFSALDFNVAVFAPFSTMRSENATSRRTMTSHLLGKTPPFALLETLRSLQLGPLLSLVGALVASVLTIVVSGLYSVEMLSSDGPTRTLNQLDVFNLTWNDSYAVDNGAAATLSLVEHLNISYPDFTYGELTFPSIALGELDERLEALSLISGPATATVPALRANLDCEILPESAYNVSSTKAGPNTENSVDTAFVNAEYSLPPQCQLAGYQGNDSILRYANAFFLVPEGESVYAGAQLDIVFGNKTFGQNYGETGGDNVPDNPPGCPSLAFTFGSFRLNSTERTNVTTMVCFQRIQQVSATVTFLANSTAIDTARPPTVDESTVKLLPNPLSASGDTSFEYRLQNNLLNEFATFTGSGYPANSLDGSLGVTKTIDIFYQAVIGSQKASAKDLVGPTNQEYFYNATNAFYRRYMAQAINANMRKPCPASGCPSDLLSKRQASSSDLQATVSVSRPRLVQSATSKLILQILLGVMLFCGILAYLLTPMRNVLPCNPCTIAGTMALLAGSKLCWSSDEDVCECCGKPRTRDADSMIHAVGEVDHHEERAEFIPHGAEWMSDEELRRVFSRMRYTLGWWKRGYGADKRGEGKRYGIDVGRADGLDDQDWVLGRSRTRRYTDEERKVQRRSRLTGPLQEPEPPRAQTQIADELASHQVRQSRLPEWMLGPLKPDKVRVQEHELGERRSRAAEQQEVQPQPQRDSGRHSRIPNWLLGPLKPDPQDEARRGAYAAPGEAFASGALQGPDTPGLGHRGP